MFTIIVMMLLAVTPYLFNRFILPLFPVEEPALAPGRLDSLAKEIEADLKIMEAQAPQQRSYSKEATPKKPIQRFAFDPNTATVSELEQLGIPPFLAKRIDKYRQKGGKFRAKSDLRQIYDFPSALYSELEPYILLASESKNEAFNTRKRTNETEAAPPINRYPAKKTIVVFDINTADNSQLHPLRGIGDKLSLRILKFRDALGGFYDKGQYAEIYGLDSLTRAELSLNTHIEAPVKKISINTATAEQLYAHPYLRNRKLVAVIINYRNQHGPYRTVEDLEKIKIIERQTLEKLTPYLSFE